MTARDLYVRCVGEGGMSPVYFKRRLTWSEAADYVEGMNRREWGALSRFRSMANLIGRGFGSKRDVCGPLPWEVESPPSAEAVESSREWARAIERRTSERDRKEFQERKEGDRQCQDTGKVRTS